MRTAKPIIKKLFIDTNVIVNYYTGQRNDIEVLDYLTHNRKDIRLYTSSLAIVQTISCLQKSTKKRKAYSKKKTVECIEHALSRINVIEDLLTSDIRVAMNEDNNDIEDNVQYILSQKQKCDAVLTNNISDFGHFIGFSAIKSNITNVKRALRKK